LIRLFVYYSGQEPEAFTTSPRYKMDEVVKTLKEQEAPVFQTTTGAKTIDKVRLDQIIVREFDDRQHVINKFEYKKENGRMEEVVEPTEQAPSSNTTDSIPVETASIDVPVESTESSATEITAQPEINIFTPASEVVQPVIDSPVVETAQSVVAEETPVETSATKEKEKEEEDNKKEADSMEDDSQGEFESFRKKYLEEQEKESSFYASIVEKKVARNKRLADHDAVLGSENASLEGMVTK
jgi:hypothetical protein